MFRIYRVVNKQNVGVCGVERLDDHTPVVIKSPGAIICYCIPFEGVAGP